MKKISFTIWFIISVQLGFSQSTPSELITDIDQLKSLIVNKHASPFWMTTEKEFETQIKQTKEIISQKSDCDESCYVEIFKILAKIKDGHSVISGSSRYDLFGYLPFSAKWFGGELYITKTAEKHKKILGHKISKINGTDIEKVLQKLKSVVPHGNDSRLHKFVGSYIHLPGLLYGLGITNNPKEAIFTFSKNNTSFEVTLQHMSEKEEEKTTFISYLSNNKDLPLFQRDTEKYYWFDYNSNNKVLYFQYNRVGNMKGESSGKFASRLWQTVDSVAIDRFVLDIRYNGGGSFPLSLKFVQGIIDRPAINKRGKLFVITGYDTFSAAIDMLNQIELRTEAIIIGEPPCDHPSSPGDPKSHVLKNTNIKVYLSSLYHPTIFPDDDRKSTLLDKQIITTWDDYQKGHDPILDFVISYNTKGPKKVKSKKVKQWIGKYEYSPTRNIAIKEYEGQLFMEIKQGLSTPLYKKGKNSFSTETVGLTGSFNNNNIILNFPDGKTKEFKKLNKTYESAINLLYKGEIEQAKSAFKKIKKTNPNFKEFEDHNMSFLASLVYFELRNTPNISASDIAKSILNLGIELNDGKAPFCEFSLRFY